MLLGRWWGNHMTEYTPTTHGAGSCEIAYFCKPALYHILNVFCPMYEFKYSVTD